MLLATEIAHVTALKVVIHQSERLHCIRFMTERGEQVAVLLTTEEFERGLMRWVDTVDTMPIDTTEPSEREGIS